MSRELFRSATAPSRGPDNATALLSRGPDRQEGFRGLLEKLSGAHDREVDRLESEKAELEWQNKVLRIQLLEVNARPKDCEQLPSLMGSRKEGKTTHVSGASLGQSEEHAKLAALPSVVDISDRDVKSFRSGDLTEDSGRDGECDDDETPKGGEEAFPLRSDYRTKRVRTKELTDSHEFQSLLTPPLEKSLAPYRGFMAFCIASPRSSARTAWEIVGYVLIGWDLIIVPLEVFCYPVNGLTIAMEWITLVYWTLNIPQTLTVGYETKLGTVLSPSSVLMRYLKSWFWIDMAVLVPDWLTAVIGFGRSNARATSCDSAVEGAETVTLLRKLRLVRLLRLARIARLKNLWRLVKERIYSLTTDIVVNIIVMLLLLLVLSHVISCLWYAISYDIKGDNRWLVYYNMDGLDWKYLYATSLHWSLTQFTPAPIDIQPQNLPERVFTISVVVCALVGFSYVVGSITGSLAQLRSVTEEESKQFWDLRVYLKRNSVEHTLAVRIQRYLSHAWLSNQSRNRSFTDIKILEMLSEQLQNELRFHLHADHLRVYPLIQTLLDVSKVTVFRLARTAISTKQFANHDPLFIHGEKASHMSIVMHGRFSYKRRTSQDVVLSEMVDRDEDWIAEPVLWSTEWDHLGDCTAVDTSSLMLVSPHHFCEEAKRNPPAWELVTTYCRNFLKWLNSADPDELSDITQGDHVDKKAQLNTFMTTGLHPDVAAQVVWSDGK